MPTTGSVESVPFTYVFRPGAEGGERDFRREGRKLVYAQDGRGRSVGR